MEKVVTEKKAAKRIKEDAEKITKADVKEVIDRADEIRKKFAANGPLARYITDVKLLLSIVSDYWEGKYKEIPWWAIAAVVAALLYVLSPIDLIPDFLPAVGFLDDLVVITACLRMVEQQLHEYQQWKLSCTA